MNITVLIVDDNVQFSVSLAQILSGNDFIIHTAKSSYEAFPVLSKHHIDVILLDVRLGGESGTDVLVRLKDEYSSIPVVMLTGFASIESAVNSIKLGAFDYIQKPVKLEKITTVIKNAHTMASLKKENQILHNRLDDLSPQIISNDSRIHDLMETIKKLSGSNLSILLSGENGIGKELFADYIHAQSDRKASRLVKINCAAFPDSLLDNELFGHDKGAYTGANSVYKGVFERADKGTLFLDEIGDMSLNVQSKVLRVLQNKELFRLGGDKLINVDIHIISATNKRLENLIAEGKFREDLYYRLNAATISIPPLRERKGDIPLLLNHFIEEFSNGNSRPKPAISDSVLDSLMQHDWPGNIRELKNAINYAAAICVEDEIEIGDLPGMFSNNRSREDHSNVLHESEKNMILRELKRQKFNKKKVAESLNISRSTLYSKMRKHAI